ncbi:thioredoxin family protein [Denitromonas sp.]|uniref:thioredoxin family protein n=1 Tax=Denitromonas sp. TaxID=2734609 RepID=UPI003A8997F3
MAPHTPYLDTPIRRTDIDALDNPAVLDFGTNGCGYCQGAAPRILAALARHPNVQHLRIEDGPGRRLGRSFGVKLWPTLVFLQRGQEVARLVRPDDDDALEQALARIDPDA